MRRLFDCCIKKKKPVDQLVDSEICHGESEPTTMRSPVEMGTDELKAGPKIVIIPSTPVAAQSSEPHSPVNTSQILVGSPLTPIKVVSSHTNNSPGSRPGNHYEIASPGNDSAVTSPSSPRSRPGNHYEGQRLSTSSLTQFGSRNSTPNKSPEGEAAVHSTPADTGAARQLQF